MKTAPDNLHPMAKMRKLGGQPRGYQIFRSFEDLFAPSQLDGLVTTACQLWQLDSWMQFREAPWLERKVGMSFNLVQGCLRLPA